MAAAPMASTRAGMLAPAPAWTIVDVPDGLDSEAVALLPRKPPVVVGLDETLTRGREGVGAPVADGEPPPHEELPVLTRVKLAQLMRVTLA